MRCIRFFAASAVVVVLAGPSDGMAIEATAKQREACAPDVFRLCKPDVPDVDKDRSVYGAGAPKFECGMRCRFHSGIASESKSRSKKKLSRMNRM